MNTSPSSTVEVYLTLKATGANAPELTEMLTQCHVVYQVMHIGHGTVTEMLQFQFSLANENLDNIIATIGQSKYSVRQILVHFPSAASGIHDNYHSAAATNLEGVLLKLPAIVDVSISANGVIKIETNPFIQNQNAVVLAAFELIKTNLSQFNS